MIVRNMKFWLVMSLIVNVLLIGAWVGDEVFDRGRDKMRPPVNEIGALLRVLPDDARADFGDRLRGRIAQREHAESMERVEELATLIATDPFAEQAVEDLLANWRFEAQGIAEKSHEDIVATLRGLTVDERLLVAERLRALPKSRGGRTKDHSSRHN